LTEVCVLSNRSGRKDIAEQYHKLLTQSGSMNIAELNNTIATGAAELRAKYNLKTPDSIQLATAM
jgi:predicted nucleic acid-binding protein